jgi:hypothetical protein
MNPALLILFRLLEGLFAIGIAGSVIVLCIATVEDVKVLFEKDKPAPGTGVRPEEQISDEGVVSRNEELVPDLALNECNGGPAGSFAAADSLRVR